MSIGRLMLDLQGKEILPEEKELLALPSVGGVILFSRNFENTTQLQKLVKQIRAIKSNILISVDHEGGRVQRFREGFTIIPAMAKLGEVYGENPSAALELSREIGWLMAAELRCFDIDFTFAPVLDVEVGISKVIGDRSFSCDDQIVAKLAECLISGMDEAGMGATGKHFPGHGAVEADSHVDIPRDERTIAEIEARDLNPFKYLASRGLKAVMPAHVIYTSVDNQPAGFSNFWLETYLRNKLNFTGVIFSDDLSMEGASVAGSFIERAEVALEAGCDMVLVCNNQSAAQEVAQWLASKNDCCSELLGTMVGKPWAMSLSDLKSTERWQAVNAEIQLLIERS